MQWITRSRSRWNTGRMGSCGSGRARPRLASLKVAQGAKVSRSISSVRWRTSIWYPSLSCWFLPPSQRSCARSYCSRIALSKGESSCPVQNYPIKISRCCCAQSAAAMQPCIRLPMAPTSGERTSECETERGIRTAHRTAARRSPRPRPASAPAAVPAAAARCPPASASAGSRGR